jgi:predicted small secreted protein
MLTKTRLKLLLPLTFMALGLVACGTLDGAGRDIEHAGESVQDAAK